MPSLYDVAKQAGVSKSTVSRVINNEAGVKQATRDKVFDAVRQTGYVVNQVAKDLRSKTTNLIGVIVPRIASNAVAEGIEGLTKVFDAEGKQVLLANCRLKREKELEFIELFNQKRVAGIIIFATHINEVLISAIESSKVPVVVVGQDASSHGIPSIIHDDFGVGMAAAQVLHEARCKRVGFISVQEDDVAVDQLRYSGFELKVRQLLGQDPVFHTHGDFSVQSGKSQVEQLIQSGASFDGIFCATDNLAIGAMQALKDSGLEVGKEVQVVSVGNDEKSEIVSPSLTAFDYAFESAGSEAAALLLDLCNDETRAVSKLVLNFSLVKRESCQS